MGLVEKVGPRPMPWANAITWFGYRVLESMNFPIIRDLTFAWTCLYLWIWGRVDMTGELVYRTLVASSRYRF